ncbi:hypothetical protein ABBQ32_011353 [Trebouxia sp. C0010 RCD-2024]
MNRDESVRVNADEVMDAVSWDQYSRFRRGAIWPNPFKLEAVYDAGDEEGLVFRVRGETGSYDVVFQDSIMAPYITVSCSCPDPFAGLCKHICWVLFKVLKHDDLAVFSTGLVPVELVWHVTQNEDAQARMVEAWGRNTGLSIRLPDRQPSLRAWLPPKECPFRPPKNWPPINLECAVCFEDMEQEQAKQCPRCFNSFHDACIARWFLQKRSCPLCRKTFC